VTKPGGLFLVSVEIDHRPTATEPLVITEGDMTTLIPEFRILSSFKVATPENHDLHRAVLDRLPAHQPGKPGVYVAKMQRQWNSIAHNSLDVDGGADEDHFS
jgi:hypothetical protein